MENGLTCGTHCIAHNSALLDLCQEIAHSNGAVSTYDGKRLSDIRVRAIDLYLVLLSYSQLMAAIRQPCGSKQAQASWFKPQEQHTFTSGLGSSSSSSSSPPSSPPASDCSLLSSCCSWLSGEA